MIKTAFNKNKIPFICFSINLALLSIAFILSCIPTVEEIYGIYYFSDLFFYSNYHSLLLVATLLVFITLFVDNEKMNNLLKTIALSLLIAPLARDLIYYLLCELADLSKYYFQTGDFLMYIANDMYLVVCILLLIAHLKKLSKMFILISSALTIPAFIFYLVGGITYIKDYISFSSLTPILVAAITETSFIVGFVLLNIKVVTNKSSTELSSSVRNKLDALKIKYEVGSITKEEYETERLNVLKDIQGE